MWTGDRVSTIVSSARRPSPTWSAVTPPPRRGRSFVRSSPARVCPAPLSLGRFVLGEVVADDAHLAASQTGRVPVVLAVELPCRAAVVAVRVNLMAVGEPEMQAAVLVPARVGAYGSGEVE